MGEARPSLRLSTLWQRAMCDSSLTAMAGRSLRWSWWALRLVIAPGQ
jgi:hypothetical protein